METSKLSVIMPVYNVKDFVEKAVLSVVEQTYRNIELILIDDGSTDGSSEICKKLAECDPRITLICKENQGVSVARNVGLRAATGEYITFVDSDDWIERDAYEKQMNYIKETKADICVMGFIIEENNGFVCPLKKEKAQLLDVKTGLENLISGEIYTWSIWDKIYKRKIINDVLFLDSIVNGEDFLFNWRSFHRADKVAYLPINGYHYVQRRGSITNSFSRDKLTVLEVFNIILEESENDKVICDIVKDKYFSVLIGLFINYSCSSNYSCWGYEFRELLSAKTFLRTNWKRILLSKNNLKAKVAFLIIMLPTVFTTMFFKCYKFLK